MPSKNILLDTVTLYNYIGEVNDVATYAVSVITNCKCTVSEGADLNDQGRKGHDSAVLYIFDKGSTVRSQSGEKKSFLPYSAWRDLEDKSQFWTLNDNGRDYMIKSGESGRKLHITKFVRRKVGSKRMWHHEVHAK